MSKFTISVLPDLLAIARLEVDEETPEWAVGTGFLSITRTPDELSIVCAVDRVPEKVHASRGWRALKLEGPFDLDLVGVLVSVAVPLAQAGVGILPIGSYDTDYLLVRARQLNEAVKSLVQAGFDVQGV
jgi:uncharacterized protein